MYNLFNSHKSTSSSAYGQASMQFAVTCDAIALQPDSDLIHRAPTACDQPSRRLYLALAVDFSDTTALFNVTTDGDTNMSIVWLPRRIVMQGPQGRR
jgi:hypothetical protein